MNNIQNHVLEYVSTTNQKHIIHIKQPQNPNLFKFLFKPKDYFTILLFT